MYLLGENSVYDRSQGIVNNIYEGVIAGTPNENIVQNHFERILVFKR